MDFSQFKMIFVDVVEAVCKHPQMYTMNGTFAEVTAYLEGYTTADSKNSRRELHGFNRWLSAKLGYPSHVVSWVYLHETYPDDAQALKELSRLYREYADFGDDSNGELEDEKQSD
jgi:hypothetical protein